MTDGGKRTGTMGRRRRNRAITSNDGGSDGQTRAAPSSASPHHTRIETRRRRLSAKNVWTCLLSVSVCLDHVWPHTACARDFSRQPNPRASATCPAHTLLHTRKERER